MLFLQWPVFYWKEKKNSILNCRPSKFIKLSEKKFYGFSNIISIQAIF